MKTWKVICCCCCPALDRLKLKWIYFPFISILFIKGKYDSLHSVNITEINHAGCLDLLKISSFQTLSELSLKWTVVPKWATGRCFTIFAYCRNWSMVYAFSTAENFDRSTNWGNWKWNQGILMTSDEWRAMNNQTSKIKLKINTKVK